MSNSPTPILHYMLSLNNLFNVEVKDMVADKGQLYIIIKDEYYNKYYLIVYNIHEGTEKKYLLHLEFPINEIYSVQLSRMDDQINIFTLFQSKKSLCLSINQLQLGS